MLFIYRSICSNHRWNLILTSVQYYCLSPPRRYGAFYSTSSAHSELVHISKSVFCKEISRSLPNFAIFLPVICLYFCFRDSTSLEKFAISLPVRMVCKFYPLRILQYNFAIFLGLCDSWWDGWKRRELFCCQFLSRISTFIRETAGDNANNLWLPILVS